MSPTPAPRLSRLAAALACAVLLAACESSEERAEGHYQAGLEHLEAGDVDRALVEFRNVFDLDGFHREARATYARLMRERGRQGEAMGQYLRLVEQYPDDLEARRALTEMAIASGDWEAVERHATHAASLAPEDASIRAALVGLAYRDALEAGDDAARGQAAREADALLRADPELAGARFVALDDRLRAGDAEAALALVEGGIEIAPNEPDLWTRRLQLLRETGREEEIGPSLREMAERFPEDQAIRATLIRWLVSQDELGEAEAFLRGLVDPADPEPGARVTLVRFLQEMRGPEAAGAEIDRILAEGASDPVLFGAMRAGLEFEAGEREAAIARMRAVLEEASPDEAAPGRVESARVALARMLEADGNPVGAREQVELALEADPSQVEALKLRAAWLVEDDETGDAIADLRQALGTAPRDPEILTLLARAHEREGNRELMAEMLALAVDASEGAPEPALRYAAHLVEEGRTGPAEDVLMEAMRANPRDVDLARALGRLYVSTGEWERVEQAVATLRGVGTEEAERAADGLVALRLGAQDREGELMDFLEELSEEGEARADAAIVRSHLARGDAEAALAHAEAALERAPDDPSLRFLRAAVLAGTGRDAEAEAEYRALLDERPEAERVWLALHGLERARGDLEAAGAVLREAVEAAPGSVALRWTRAGALEQAGDVEGAIAIYDALYEEDSDNPVIANNLASLITTHRSDAESLERAAVIARRLRGSDVPQFQDTYGWIALRRGDVGAAIEHLEPAAAGLPDDPRVQHHWGLALARAGRGEEARGVLERTLALLGEARPDYREAVEAELAALSEGAGAEAEAEPAE
jgi:tetratricopeptide (TPR) repeat protein